MTQAPLWASASHPLSQEAPCQRKCWYSQVMHRRSWKQRGEEHGSAPESPKHCKKRRQKRYWARGQETPTWRLLLSLPCSVALKGIRILHPKICHFGIRVIWAKGNWELTDAWRVLCPPFICLKVGHKLPFEEYVLHPSSLYYREKATLIIR